MLRGLQWTLTNENAVSAGTWHETSQESHASTKSLRTALQSEWHIVPRHVHDWFVDIENLVNGGEGAPEYPFAHPRL